VIDRRAFVATLPIALAAAGRRIRRFAMSTQSRTRLLPLWTVVVSLAGTAVVRMTAGAQAPAPAAPAASIEIVAVDAAACSAATLGSAIPATAIGEPVRRVALAAPAWVAETATAPATAADGVIDAVTRVRPRA
jgi:hypothetical protein